MRVFIDYHHHDLYWSLAALFEKRLGFELYRPIGLDWFREGFSKIAEPYGNAPDTIEQYLAIGPEPGSAGGFDALRRLNGNAQAHADGTYRIPDPTHPGFEHKAITLEQFKETPFDLIVSTYGAPHDHAFDELQRLYQPKAKRLAQMGNWQQQSHVRHVLHSVPWTGGSSNAPVGQQHLHYHQEIDRELYKHVPPDMGALPYQITSCVNLLPAPQIYGAFKAELEMDALRFSAYGTNCPDGRLDGAAEVSAAMRQAHLGWHIKPFDGFGHTAMGWMATGRGVITRMDEIQEYGHDAPRLFVPGETCIAIQGWDVKAGATKIRRALEPDECVRYGEAAAARFAEVCNYDAEEHSIRVFLEGLMS